MKRVTDFTDTDIEVPWDLWRKAPQRFREALRCYAVRYSETADCLWARVATYRVEELVEMLGGTAVRELPAATRCGGELE